MVFFADLNYISDTYRGHDGARRSATRRRRRSTIPIPLLSFMAAATTRIGLGATFSISHSHPFYAARLWATLDHLTRGRAAWNVVTSLNHNQSANYGEERQPDRRALRPRARVHRGLPQALGELGAGRGGDGPRGRRVRRSRPRCTASSTRARFFRSRGPLNVVRSPQNGPAILQAGTSPEGADVRRAVRGRASSRSSRTSRAPRRTTTTSRAPP